MGPQPEIIPMSRRSRWLTLAATMLLGMGGTVEAANSFPASTYARRSDDWYRSDEGRKVAANVLSHQSELGSWPKNIDTSASPFDGDRAKLQGTFDNGA